MTRDPLRPGDTCVLITDGTFEARLEDSNDRLRALEASLRGLAGRPAQELCEKVLETVPRRPDGSLEGIADFREGLEEL